jgi:hypothetical protein
LERINTELEKLRTELESNGEKDIAKEDEIEDDFNE